METNSALGGPGKLPVNAGQGEIGPAMHAGDARAGALFLKMQRHVLCVSRGRRSAHLFKILSGENVGEQRMRIAPTPRDQGTARTMIDGCMAYWN